MSESNLSDLLSCDFCTKDENNVRTLIVREKTGICDECVMTCIDVLKNELDKSKDKIKKLHIYKKS